MASCGRLPSPLVFCLQNPLLPPLGGKCCLGRGRARPKSTFFKYVSQSLICFPVPVFPKAVNVFKSRRSSEIGVWQLRAFCDFSILWGVSGSTLAALLVTVVDSGDFLNNFWHQNASPGHPKNNAQPRLAPKTTSRFMWVPRWAQNAPSTNQSPKRLRE